MMSEQSAYVLRTLLLTRDQYRDHLMALDTGTGESLGSYDEPVRREVINAAKKIFPDNVRIETGSEDRVRNKIIVLVYSDVEPVKYFLHDRKKGSFEYLAGHFPDIASGDMAPVQELEYAAGDGRKIPAYLTVPASVSGQAAPIVVIPDGMPYWRSYADFNPLDQFFASKGYIVFRPQYRGTVGSGVEHEEAGYHQVGKLAQSDVSDGVYWLVEQGYADPARVCILGENYGAYIAMMGLVTEPDLYRCAVGINGVYDLPYQLRDIKNHRYSQGKRLLIDDYAQAKQYSPHHRAKAIEAPVLLIGSEKDTVVDVVHSRSFEKKLGSLGKSVRYMELAGADHWRTNEADDLKVYQAIEQFFEKHLAEVAD